MGSWATLVEVKRFYQRLLRFVLGLGLVALLLGVVTRWHGFTLGGGHVLRQPQATLSGPLQTRIDEIHTERMPSSAEEVRDLALRITAQLARFSLGHAEGRHFTLQPRAANCRELADLYGTVFNRIAERRQVAARALVVRSHDPRVFGFQIPHRSFRDHDWVLVQPAGATPSESWYVDPSLNEVWLDWNVEGNVRGSLPRKLAPAFASERQAATQPAFSAQ